MSEARFKIYIGLCGALLLASAAPFPGALIGFFAGITVAFFVAPAMFGLDFVVRAAGYTLDFRLTAICLGGLYAVVVMTWFGRAALCFNKGDVAAARAFCARGVAFVTGPSALYLSGKALVDAWP